MHINFSELDDAAKYVAMTMYIHSNYPYSPSNLSTPPNETL